MHEQNESQPKSFIKILFALFTALLVVVLGYLCIQIYTIFHRTYKTETIRVILSGVGARAWVYSPACSPL